MKSDAFAATSSSIPRHIAIVMDGNGRWGMQHAGSRLNGHEAGTENIRRILRHCAKRGVRYLTLWAFSTENWRRPKDEIDGLMRLLGQAIVNEIEELDAQGAQLRHIGDLSALDLALQAGVREAIRRTSANSRIVVTLAFNYGGQQELVHAIRHMIREGLSADDVTIDSVRHHLYMPELPDPDLIIRTSGEYRLSGFLMWQSAYSELFFSDKLWPDFDTNELDAAINEFALRDRRYGGLSAQASS